MVELNKYRHVIWDWNGTLLDDVWLCVESVNESLSRRRLPLITEETYRELFDFPVIDFYRQLGFDFEVESFEDLSVEYHSQYEPRWIECRFQPGAREALESLANTGLNQSLLSAAHQEMLDACVEHFNLGEHFVHVTGLDNKYADGKVELGRRLLGRLRMDPRDVLLIGDTVHDHEVARALGVDCVLTAAGHHSREKLEPCGVQVFDSPAEIFNGV